MFFIPTKININSLKMNNPDHSGTVTFGSAKVVNKNISGKKNQGFGQQLADFSIALIPIHMVSDDDRIETYSVKNTQSKMKH